MQYDASGCLSRCGLPGSFWLAEVRCRQLQVWMHQLKLVRVKVCWHDAMASSCLALLVVMKGAENLPALAPTRRLLTGLGLVKDLLHFLIVPGICHLGLRLLRYKIWALVVHAQAQGTVFLSPEEYACPFWQH